MRWHGKHMVRTAHPTARSILPADFSGFKLRPSVGCRCRPNRHRTPHAVAKSACKKATTPGSTAPPAVGCAVRTKEKSSDAVLSPMFPDNKAVQPCLARQADIRRAISFDSPLPWRNSRTKKADLTSEQRNGCKGPWPGAADRPSRSRSTTLAVITKS